MTMPAYLAILKKSIAKQLGKVLKYESKALEGDVEAVHDYRVAMRRIRTALRLIAPMVKNSKQADKLRKKGGQFARAFGPVRDLDVLLQNLDQDFMQPPAPETWKAALRMERQNALSHAQEVLEGDQYSKWKHKLEAWLKKDLKPKKLGNPLDTVITQHAQEIANQTTAQTDRELHSVRIASKRLRYLLEFFKKELPPKSRKAISELIKTQNLLGDYRDTVLMIKKLESAITTATDPEILGQLKEFHCALKQRHEAQKSQIFSQDSIVRDIPSLQIPKSE